MSYSVATAALGGFLIVASLIFEGISLGWLLAIAGGTVQALTLVAFASPRYRLRAALAGEGQVAAAARVAA